jgi:uncharacterized protein YjbI with pentapeptide repeats
MPDAQPLRHQGQCLASSAFTDVDLTGSSFDDVCLRKASFTNVSMRQAEIRNADLSDLTIADANLDGMTIDGVAVLDLFRAWRAAGPDQGRPDSG